MAPSCSGLRLLNTARINSDDTSQSRRSPVSTKPDNGVSRSMAIRAPMNSADMAWAALVSLSATESRGRAPNRRTRR